MKKISLFFACIGILSFTAIAQEVPQTKKTSGSAKVSPAAKGEKIKVPTANVTQGPSSKTTPVTSEKRPVRKIRPDNKQTPKSDVKHYEKSVAK